MSTIFRTILLASFAMWFGGFGFYVSIVVPIGTEVLGSALDQGMITRRVATWINVFSGIAFAMMLVESVLTWNQLRPFIRRAQLGLCLFMVVSLIGLVYLHFALDSMIDAADMRVADRETFYHLHRVYLWLSTIQWAAGWGWLIVLLAGWRKLTVNMK